VALTVVVMLLCAWLGQRLGSEEAGQFDPSTSGLTQLWAHAGPRTAFFFGVNTHGGVISFATSSGVTAYDPQSGATRWSWSPPPGASVCTAAASGETALVAYGFRVLSPDEGCSAVVAIDLAGGAVLWSRPVPAAQLVYLAAGDGQALVEFQAESSDTTGGDTTGGDTTLSGLDDYNLATGAPGWTNPLGSESASSCMPGQPFVAGDAISMVDRCADESDFFGGASDVYSFAADTGKQRSDLRLAPRLCADGVMVYTGPEYLVAGCTGLFGVGGQSVVFVDPATGSQHSAQVATDYFTRTVVYGDTAYLTIEKPVNSTRADDQAIAAAFDLSTGSELWQRAVPGYQVTMISADSAGALAAVYNGATLSLVRYAPSGGTPTVGPGTALSGASEAELSALARNGDLDLEIDGDVLLAGGARTSALDFAAQTSPSVVGLSIGAVSGF
jgi:hypothetical protein